MGVVTEAIAADLEHILKGADRLGDPIAPEHFARFPVGKDGPVVTNHPAFVFGHLSLYPWWMLEAAGLESDGMLPPEGYLELFKAPVPCRDDPDGSIYPGKDELLGVFRRGYGRVVEALPGLDDARLGDPTPIERFREKFPTLGGTLMFVFLGHTMMHIGQVSAWRRMMGYGSAM